MPFSAGDKLGPYEILAKIGAGGMGEVYRAHDPRLRRDVAIKVSAERFSERFEREAHAVAALNHPNICAIYDVGPNYLVMEYVEGEAPKGPLPLEEALRIARQIGDALEEAHAKGIVHRDLKPANIKIKPDGTVKVLDFGLAKMGQSNPVPRVRIRPRLSMAATQAGMILGTAAYMSPEQARGKVVDKRADIWAFGVVIHELLTGRKLFGGEDISDTLAAVIKEEPKWEGVPPKVQRLLKSCLEKDPKNRLRDIGGCVGAAGTSPARQGGGAIEGGLDCGRGRDRCCAVSLCGRHGAPKTRRQAAGAAGCRPGAGDLAGSHCCRPIPDSCSSVVISPRWDAAGVRGKHCRRAAAAFHAAAGSTQGHRTPRHNRGDRAVLFAGRAMGRIRRRRQIQQDLGGRRGGGSVGRDARLGGASWGEDGSIILGGGTLRTPGLTRIPSGGGAVRR